MDDRSGQVVGSREHFDTVAERTLGFNGNSGNLRILQHRLLGVFGRSARKLGKLWAIERGIVFPRLADGSLGALVVVTRSCSLRSRSEYR